MKTDHVLATLLVVGCMHLVDITCAPSPAFKPSQPLPPSPLDDSDKFAINYLTREAAREKRGSASGSGDILNHIKKSVAQGIKNKISQIAKSSAGASAYFSHSSSGHGGHGHHVVPHDYHHYIPPHPHHYYPHHHHHHDEHAKPFDFWNLKKSVLYTLLQAVKAIKGGVIAIKGQLIKGSGHLLTAKGKLIRGGGEALTTIGKHLASSAFMIVPHHDEEEEPEHGHDHVVHTHDEHYSHPTGTAYEYTAPTGPTHGIPLSGPSASSTYGSAPSGPSVGTGAGYYHNSIYDGKDHPQADGLIILRKIPKHLRHPSDSDDEQTTHQHEQEQQQQHHEQLQAYHQQHYQHAYDAEQDTYDGQGQESHKTPSFKPLADTLVPKMQSLMGSVFHSSSYPDGPPSKTPPQSVPPKDSVTSHSVHTKITKANANAEKVKPQQAQIGSERDRSYATFDPYY